MARTKAARRQGGVGGGVRLLSLHSLQDLGLDSPRHFDNGMNEGWYEVFLFYQVANTSSSYRQLKTWER